MAIVELKGRITAAGKLEVELPPDLPQGEVEITLKIHEEEQPWTEEEIAQYLTFTPRTGAEIVASGVLGAWHGIEDSEAWVQEQRRKRAQARQLT